MHSATELEKRLRIFNKNQTIYFSNVKKKKEKKEKKRKENTMKNKVW
jgi:hypothetical protein